MKLPAAPGTEFDNRWVGMNGDDPHDRDDDPDDTPETPPDEPPPPRIDDPPRPSEPQGPYVVKEAER